MKYYLIMLITFSNCKPSVNSNLQGTNSIAPRFDETKTTSVKNSFCSVVVSSDTANRSFFYNTFRRDQEYGLPKSGYECCRIGIECGATYQDTCPTGKSCPQNYGPHTEISYKEACQPDPKLNVRGEELDRAMEAYANACREFQREVPSLKAKNDRTLINSFCTNEAYRYIKPTCQ